jgi:ribonuclease BN (tRNA processing enzyme)
MKIQILGTRGEIESSLPNHSKHSGISVDKTLLFDCGEKEFLKLKPKAIFLTHLHPDHAYFVRKGLVEIPPIKVKIFAPEKPENDQIHSVISVLTKEFSFGDYKIIPIPTHHSLNVKSQAYLIKKNEKSILYTGDLVWIDKKYHALFKSLDLVITEASYIRKGGLVRKDKNSGKIYGHQGVPDLIKLFAPYTKHILFVHFGSWFFKDPAHARKKIEELGKSCGIEAIVGSDGMDIIV